MYYYFCFVFLRKIYVPVPLTYIYHTGYLFCLFLFGEIYKIYKSVTADFLDLQFHIHNNDIKRNKSVAVQWANLDSSKPHVHM